MKKKLMALLVGAVLTMATSAMALPMIGGQINFTGSLSLKDSLFNPATSLTATYIDFVQGTTAVSQLVSGTYATIPTPPPITNVTEAIFKDFSFATSSPVIGLWTVTSGLNTYSFDLESITASRTSTSLVLSGIGKLHATGYEDTLGTWALTTQGGSGNMSFSATSAPVPEPGTMVLLGAGLLGLAIYGKRRMNKEA